jgi:hypothetical protein
MRPMLHWHKCELSESQTAKALGLSIPPSVLGRADQIIQ